MKTEKDKSFIGLTWQNPSVASRLMLQKHQGGLQNLGNILYSICIKLTLVLYPGLRPACQVKKVNEHILDCPRIPCLNVLMQFLCLELIGFIAFTDLTGPEPSLDSGTLNFKKVIFSGRTSTQLCRSLCSVFSALTGALMPHSRPSRNVRNA